MAEEITRYIKREVERELWARAAGRCQFDGCNKILYKSPVTNERVNISEKAHIYSFSQDGPRGRGPFIINRHALNDISNLMLTCHDCHKTIDQDKQGERYSASLLLNWKKKHEQKICIVSGISSEKKSHIVLYGANIGEDKLPLDYVSSVESIFPDWYPAEEKAINLSMLCEHEDRNQGFWQTEQNNLRSAYERYVVPRIQENNHCHFSVFAFAPQPLLVLLGALFTDKIPVEVYQLHREPPSWRWQRNSLDCKYIINPPKSFDNPPALIISLSDKIAPERITNVIGKYVSIWELTIKNPHNDFMKSKQQLSMFRETVRKLMVDIKTRHGATTPLSIFSAMPVACAVETGRVRMPKADMPWIVYDQNSKENSFIKAILIPGDNYGL